MHLEMEIKSLTKELRDIKQENQKLKEVIIKNDLSDEIEMIHNVSEEEQSCIDGIAHLKPLFENGTFQKQDVQMLEILINSLRKIRGNLSDNKKHKPMKPEDIKKNLKLLENE